MTDTPRFQRRVEDFICEHCGFAVVGSGYTNHCPKCLWSKHVDMHPGDRAAECGGMMEPIGIEGTTPKYRIVHRCLSCGRNFRNKISESDSTEEILRIARKAQTRDT